MKHITCLFLLTVFAAAGCDPFGTSSKNEQLALERQRQEDIRQEREEHERREKMDILERKIRDADEDGEVGS